MSSCAPSASNMQASPSNLSRHTRVEKSSVQLQEKLSQNGCVIPNPQFGARMCISGPCRTRPVGLGTPGNANKHGIPKKPRGVSDFFLFFDNVCWVLILKHFDNSAMTFPLAQMCCTLAPTPAASICPSATIFIRDDVKLAHFNQSATVNPKVVGSIPAKPQKQRPQIYMDLSYIDLQARGLDDCFK